MLNDPVPESPVPVNPSKVDPAAGPSLETGTALKASRRRTIFDLEKATGFSRGTISRAFNKRPEVSARTQEIILRKAAEIGYSPHSGARSMTMGRTRRWGFMVPHLQNPFYSELMEAMDREARLRDTMLLVGLSHNDRDLESELISHWASGETDGLIISSHTAEIDPKMIMRLRGQGFPAVFLYIRPSPDFDLVATDVENCLDRAMRYLLDLGHRRIAYLGQESGFCRRTGPYISYNKIFERKLTVFDENLVFFGLDPAKAAAQAWKKWRNLAEPPTAVVCFNDLMACWLGYIARTDGAVIPRDLSIIGNDDIAEASRSSLTTVRVDTKLMAAEVFALLDQPRGEDEPARTRLIQGDFIVRDSVGAPRAGALARS